MLSHKRNACGYSQFWKVTEYFVQHYIHLFTQGPRRIQPQPPAQSWCQVSTYFLGFKTETFVIVGQWWLTAYQFLTSTPPPKLFPSHHGPLIPIPQYCQPRKAEASCRLSGSLPGVLLSRQPVEGWWPNCSFLHDASWSKLASYRLVLDS